MEPDKTEQVRRDDEIHQIDQAEIAALTEKWPTYRDGKVGSSEVIRWLRQFGDFANQRVMFKLLKRLKIYDAPLINQFAKDAHKIFAQEIKRALLTNENRKRSDIVVTWVGGDLKSSQRLAQKYKTANRIYSDKLIPPMLLSETLRRNQNINCIVVLDDFIATGRSLISTLGETLNAQIIQTMQKNEIFLGLAAMCADSKAEDQVSKYLES